ncbi:MAG TPA: SusC/RagA family TonB-linked outer membrane protein [Gemmatimonadaceae bacterium]|nr:SusC/RagA family TonB-linked outer membrane protein [Gemmatimonadaceae bacterium]
MKAHGSVVSAAMFMAALFLVAPPHLAAQQATITGRVTAQGSAEPLSEARVYVVGSALNVGTTADGRYTIRGAPLGTVNVRVIRVGYQEQKKSVSVTAGATVTLDFSMQQAIVQLQEIVTTATGQQRRVEIGNTVATIGDVGKKVEETPITNAYDLLVAKAPGVSVLPGNMTGTAGSIRIRGVSSLSLSNAPIWVVDGVRFNAGAYSVRGAGGSMVSSTYLNALNPEDIEDIEIVKGPSAATLYGTDASNGVIVVTTKKGKAGNTKWNWFGEGGKLEDKSHYPDTWAIWGHSATSPNNQIRCFDSTLSTGACIKDSVTFLNIISDSRYTPISTGNRNQYGLQVNGGSDVIRYFVSGDMENETGPLKMPGLDVARFDAQNIGVRDEWLRPEFLQNTSLRTNLSAALSPQFDLTVTAGFTKTNQRLGQTDNNFNSVFYQAMMAPGFAHPGLGYTDKDSRGQELYGNTQFTYGDIFQRFAREDVQRMLGTMQASWRPLSWMQNDGTVGVDFAARDSYGLCRYNECPDFSSWRLGAVGDGHLENRNFSAKFTSNASWQARTWLVFKTTAGADYTNQENESTTASATNLPPGAQTVGAGAVTQGGGTLPSADKTYGAYVQEQATLRDRLFLTVAMRQDQNSAFGTNFQSITYPKASASWIASDEPFFPQYSWLNQFRLRVAYGASGVQPGSTSAFVTFNAPVVSVNATDTPGLRANSLGNADLKPETSTEIEGGFDARVLGNRANLELTLYQKKTKDALYSQNIAPSVAPSALSVLRNLGSVQNTGIEAAINTTILDLRRFGWDVSIAASHNSNKVLSLGLDAAGKPNPTNGTGSTRDSVGLPVHGQFYRVYTYADSNHDGLITANEVTVDPTFRYVGYAVPRDIFSVTNGIDLLNRTVRINGLFDYKGGYLIFNSTKNFQCQQNPACPGRSDPTASLEDQAAAIATTAKNPSTAWGYLENGQFWRFRELSATWRIPTRAVQLARAGDATLVFGARNLKVWTKYKGADPEENFSTGDTQSTFASSAPRRYYTVRLNLHY